MSETGGVMPEPVGIGIARNLVAQRKPANGFLVGIYDMRTMNDPKIIKLNVDEAMNVGETLIAMATKYREEQLEAKQVQALDNQAGK